MKQKKKNERPTSPSPLEKELLSQRFPSSIRDTTPRLNRSQTLLPQAMNDVRNVSIAAHAS